MNDAASISTPEYFSSTFGVDAATAASLAQQANAAGTRGSGLATPPPVSPVVASGPVSAAAVSPALPGTAALSAQAEYEQLMSDRASGKINAAQWAATGSARERALADLIADGAGAQPAPAAKAPAAPFHPYLGAPSSPDDYGFLHGTGELPPDQVATITAQQEAIARLDLSRTVVQDVHDRLRTYAAEFQNLSPDAVQSRLEGNYSRFTAQCAREGISVESAYQLIGAQVKQWSIAEPATRELLADMAKIGDPTILDYVLQIAQHRRAAGLL
jgi:hypothetical protein